MKGLLVISSVLITVSVFGAQLDPKVLRSHDWFGGAIDVDGDYAVVGARYDDEGGSNAGAAYVFRRSGDGWKQAAKLMPEKPQAGANFGQSVAIRGDLVIVGAQLEDHANADWLKVKRDAGAAYIFKRSGKEWTQVARLVSSKAQQWDQFGFAVDIEGEVAVAGAPIYSATDREGNLLHGAVCAFENVNSGWREAAFLELKEPRQADQHGQAVAVSGTTLFVGGADNGRGAIHIYRKAEKKWRYSHKIQPSETTRLCRFGTALAVDGDKMVVGAKFDDTVARDAGCVFVFERADTALSSVNGMNILSDPEIKATHALMMKSRPKITASHEQRAVGNLLDVDKDNRWTVGGSQKLGAWLMLAFKRPLKVVHIVLDAGKSAGDYPRGYEVYFSNDGKKWGDPVAKGKGTTAVTEIRDLSGKPKYIKVVQTSSQGPNWSIHDLRINGFSLSGGAKDWKMVKILTADDGKIGDAFGTSVDIRDNTVTAGAPYVDLGKNDSAGALYVFEKSAKGWNQVRKIEEDKPEWGARLGSSAAIAEKDFLIGAVHSDDKGVDSGKVVCEKRTGK